MCIRLNYCKIWLIPIGLKSPQNIHRLIAVPIKCEMQGAEGAGVIELGEIDLVGEVGGAPVAL